ncbi:MAG: hypothetical protein LBB35_03525, partial [Coriobacteriaceae bacterium]|nr:hypothetical protein [Coriobacteriaceae bacterium]
MGKIAHLKVTCPQCGKYSSIYVEESGGTNARVKCEHCKQVFEFGAGMMYEPVAYVPSIPAWAKITEADKSKSFVQTTQCKKCGSSYDSSDLELAKINERMKSEKKDDPLSSMLSEALFNHVVSEASKLLYKCGNCSAIACSKCALESDSLTGKRCPFCEADYTMYSKIEPSPENISSGNSATEQSQTS